MSVGKEVVSVVSPHESTPAGRSAWIRFGASLSLAAAFGVSVFFYQRSTEGHVSPSSPGGAPTEPTAAPVDPATDELGKKLVAEVESELDAKVVLVAGSERVETTRRKLGATVDKDTISRRLRKGSKPAAGLLAVRLDPAPATQVLADLKDRLDRVPIDAKMDLEHRKILPDERGVMLKVIDSLASIEDGLRHKATEISLALSYVEPKTRAKDLANIDVSQIVGWYETRYSHAFDQSDRTYNLKVAAEKLNGHIIMPGEVFSFNQSVGERSEKEGFRTAPVITAGELVDGVGGGTCQISSTLYAAAFFGGLDWVKYTPHSRPSAYIAMGLDATVVWPNVDLILKNPFEFPVVVHASVNQGRVRVEILGKERVHTVAFERDVIEEKEYETILRTDENLPTGTRQTDQPGVKGYKIKRHRYVYRSGKVVKHQVWHANYPPTKEFIRIGSKPVNPDDPPVVAPPEKVKTPMRVSAKYRIVR